MKIKTLALTAAIAATGLFTAAASAAVQHATPDGSVNFSGRVYADTCVVSVNGSGNTSSTVQLPSVFSSQLTTSGATAGDTSFNIAVTGCDSSLTSVQALFSGSNIDSTSGALINTGSATNVQVQLLQDDDATTMTLGGSTPSTQNSKSYNLNSSGNATLTYYARYLATGQAGAGSVTSTVNFTMVYQ